MLDELVIAFEFTYPRSFTHKFDMPSRKNGARGSVVVKALCYKLEGRGFDSRCGEFLNLPHLSGRTRPWGLLSL
jgi:hypothetical protein